MVGETVGSLFLGRSNDLHLLGFGDSLWDDNQLQCHFEIIKAGDQVVEQKIISKKDNTATRYLDPRQAININQEQQQSQNRPLQDT